MVARQNITIASREISLLWFFNHDIYSPERIAISLGEILSDLYQLEDVTFFQFFSVENAFFFFSIYCCIDLNETCCVHFTTGTLFSVKKINNVAQL